MSHAILLSIREQDAPTGGTSFSVNVVGTIVDGGVELQQLVTGSFTQLNPRILFSPFDVGGTKLTGIIPAGTTLRWTVPGTANNISTKITSSHN